MCQTNVFQGNPLLGRLSRAMPSAARPAPLVVQSHPDAEGHLVLRCGEAWHRVRLAENGALTLLDHPQPPRAEQILQRLGAAVPTCYWIPLWWQRMLREGPLRDPVVVHGGPVPDALVRHPVWAKVAMHARERRLHRNTRNPRPSDAVFAAHPGKYLQHGMAARRYRVEEAVWEALGRCQYFRPEPARVGKEQVQVGQPPTMAITWQALRVGFMPERQEWRREIAIAVPWSWYTRLYTPGYAVVAGCLVLATLERLQVPRRGEAWEVWAGWQHPTTYAIRGRPALLWLAEKRLEWLAGIASSDEPQ